jgi:hypothetical protein
MDEQYRLLSWIILVSRRFDIDILSLLEWHFYSLVTRHMMFPQVDTEGYGLIESVARQVHLISMNPRRFEVVEKLYREIQPREIPYPKAQE